MIPTISNTTLPVLELEDVHIAYRSAGRWQEVVHGISFAIHRGQTVGLVGESGCGKTSTAYAVMNYLGKNGKQSAGSIRFNGRDMQSFSRQEIQDVRGKKMSMVYQNPASSLNPALRIGQQMIEVLARHENLSQQQATDRTLEMFRKVRLHHPETIMQRYPYQLSGGQQQRVVISMALVTNPDLLIMDEPTTGLDVTTESAVLRLIRELKQEFDTAILYISHDLRVVAKVCDWVGVMYAGQLVEWGTAEAVFNQPQNPYTADLLACTPNLTQHYQSSRLRTIEGRVPAAHARPEGCTYASRCRFAQPDCTQSTPLMRGLASMPAHQVRCWHSEAIQDQLSPTIPLQSIGQVGLTTPAVPSTTTLLAINDLKQYYDASPSLLNRVLGREVQPFKAVDDLSLSIKEGEVFAVVGESGSGKTTTGRAIVGLLKPTDGSITFQEKPLAPLVQQRSAIERQAIQMVFQNPESTLNPNHTIGHILQRTLLRFGVTRRDERQRKAEHLLESVRLDASYAYRYPSQLSGGEKQRVAIARAFAGDPQLVVCDEAVSALDVSVQATILNLLIDLKEQTQCSYLFISHDLSVVHYIA
ncbi:MAG: dipeptide ABC transporter ATP-binding protein, partial [Phototrophicaceae bacterium]